MNTSSNIAEARIFKSNFLESFTRTSPLITFITYGSIVATFFILDQKIAQTSITELIGFYLLGLVLWTLFEYVMHRFVFHWITESPVSKRIHYIIHGVHHENPRDEERLFMPPLPGVLIISGLFGMFYIFFGTYIYAYMAGFISGYMMYVFVHYAVHAMRPVKFFKYLWKHHAMHHYKHHDKAFGVSTPLWDYVFGTMPPSHL